MLKTGTFEVEAVSSMVPLRPLIEMALQGLPAMLDVDKKLFCHRLTRVTEGMVKEGISHRYSLMTILGLRQAQQAGYRTSIDIDAVLDAVDADRSWIQSAGDLGLYLWAGSKIRPEVLVEIMAARVLERLNEYPDMGQGRTMELAWLLAGLSHMQLTKAQGIPDCSDTAFRIYELLKQNQGKHGIFGHSSTRSHLMGRLRGRIGTFADQVYPIYALSKFFEAYEVTDAVQAAQLCADAICAAQGPLGQWWWHYDSATGRAVGKYPVYSVHQEAMGPMALFALAKVINEDYDAAIYRGLNWIAGKNELHFDMRDREHNLVWRSFYQSKILDYGSNVLGLLGLETRAEGLKVKYECRPYELGWLLYAFAPFAATD